MKQTDDLSGRDARVPVPETDEARRAALIAHAENGRLRQAAPDGNACADEAEPKRKRSRRFRRFRRKLIFWLIVLIVLVIAALILYPRVRSFLTPSFDIQVPDSLSGLLPDEEMGYSSIDFTDAILGESIVQRKLIVLEQEITVTSQISQALANVTLFQKTKIIRSHGTGQYTVDLMTLQASDITVSHETALITVRIPHTVLDKVTVQLDKTEFEDTQRNWLAFGDIKMTVEQQQMLEESVYTAMQEKLSQPQLFTKADEQAILQVRELFQSVVGALSPEYVVKVVMD